MPTTCRRCPARRYLKVHAADLTRFRAAMVSAPPGPGRPVQKDSGIVVFSARNTAPAPAPAAADPAAESVLDAAVRRLAPSVLRAHQVWLPPLEPALALDVVLSAQGDQVDGSALRVALGIIDRPAHQARQVLALDLDGTAGHVAVVGAPQSGKSTLVRAFLAAACTTYAPERLAFYCLDLGGGDLAVFEPAPQVGTVAGRGRPELVRGVVRTVAGLLAGRERLFAARGIDSADAFRGLRARGALPAESLGDVVLAIDNWPALRAEYDDLEPLVLDIATRGLGYGIHLLLTAARWSDIRPNLRDGIGGRLELRLGDPNESEVDRRQAASLPRGSRDGASPPMESSSRRRCRGSTARPARPTYTGQRRISSRPRRGTGPAAAYPLSGSCRPGWTPPGCPWWPAHPPYRWASPYRMMPPGRSSSRSPSTSAAPILTCWCWGTRSRVGRRSCGPI